MSLSPTRAHQHHASPKRKREDSSPYGSTHSPSKSRNAASLQIHPLLLSQLACNDEATPSSQTSFTGKFENLAIRGSGTQNIVSAPAQHDRKRLAAKPFNSSLTDSDALLRESQMSATVTLKRDGQYPATSSFEFEAISPAIHEQSRRQSRSPPLNGEPKDNFWHDSEITGHNPTDPSDDLTGINGIGFRPTPAVAWARSQKRKQQLAEYKSRETREARQRRIERRRVSSSKDSEKENVDGRSNKIRVRFEDG